MCRPKKKNTCLEGENWGTMVDEMEGEREYKSGVIAKKAKVQSVVKALLDDPVLADVPKNPTLADVDTLIGLELGSAMRISIVKLDSTSFDVTVMNSATVKDLKLAVKQKVNDMEQSRMGHRHISWSVQLRFFFLSISVPLRS